MNKKEKFHVAKALAQAFLRAGNSIDGQVAIGNAANIVALGLQQANAKNTQTELLHLFQAIVAQLAQHGDNPGSLTSITVDGISYP